MSMHTYLRRTWLVPCLAVACWAAPSGAETELPAETLREFSQVYGLIRKHYVDEVDDEELLRNAIRGMVRGLDPHSAYIDKQQLEAFNNSLLGNFGGVGIFIDADRSLIRVVSPIEDSPADHAGLQANDYVVKINDVSTENMDIGDAANLMRGVPGTSVTLSIVRLTDTSRKDFEVVLEREIIKSPSVRSAMAEDGFGFLRINQFLRPDRTPVEVANHIDRLFQENGGKLNGLIIDLRGNPGGDLASSICVASMFLDQGLTVVTDRGRDSINTEHVSDLHSCQTPKSIALSRTVNIAVLVNKGSASAAEILAGALQDNSRGVIVGTNTFGKASVQRIYNLEATDYKSAIKLTSARYYTPSGKSIHQKGIQPDVAIEIELPVKPEQPDDLLPEKVTAKNLSNLRELKQKELNYLPEDNQFHKALEILHDLPAS